MDTEIESAQKADPGEENSPAAPAQIAPLWSKAGILCGLVSLSVFKPQGS